MLTGAAALLRILELSHEALVAGVVITKRFVLHPNPIYKRSRYPMGKLPTYKIPNARVLASVLGVLADLRIPETCSIEIQSFS